MGDKGEGGVIKNHKKWMTLFMDSFFLHILALILALKQLLNECGIGTENTENSVVGQHRALVFCQLKAMMDIVERDLLKSSMSNVTYLR